MLIKEIAGDVQNGREPDGDGRCMLKKEWPAG
jgi:hypothetical protein